MYCQQNVKIYQEYCRVPACFLHSPRPRTTQELYLKGTSTGNLSFCTSKQQTANEILTKHAKIPPPYLSVWMERSSWP